MSLEDDIKQKTAKREYTLVGYQTIDDPSITSYSKSITMMAKKFNVNYVHINAFTALDFLNAFERYNNSFSYGADGIIIFNPSAKFVKEYDVSEAIKKWCDVDCMSTWFREQMLEGSTFYPCTPSAIDYMLTENGIDTVGKKATVIGRSSSVGLPTALMLLHRDATVTICHSKTENLADICRDSDIIVSCVGQPKMIKEDWISDGATVFDVSTTKMGDKYYGDVDLQDKVDITYFSPHNIGKITTLMLFAHLVGLS